MSLNRYMYARDNPMKIVDVNGHEWWDPVADLTTAATAEWGAGTAAEGSFSLGAETTKPNRGIHHRVSKGDKPEKVRVDHERGRRR